MSKLRVDTLETLDGTKTVNVADIGTGGGGGGSVTVEDLLTSTSAANALSANQGNVLKTLVDGKVDKVTGKGLSTEDYTTVEKGKLASIEAAATANSSDSTLLNRANHTGTQLAATISDFAANVRASVLTGLSTATNAAAASTDTVLEAIGKLQAQIAGYAAAAVTFTNKRINPRVSSEASSATPAINTDSTDLHRITALAANITSFTTNLTGTPVHGQGLLVEITGTAARTIAWGASFEASTIALPTTTVGTSMLTVAFTWNSATSKWRCIGVA